MLWSSTAASTSEPLRTGSLLSRSEMESWILLFCSGFCACGVAGGACESGGLEECGLEGGGPSWLRKGAANIRKAESAAREKMNLRDMIGPSLRGTVSVWHGPATGFNISAGQSCCPIAAGYF